MRKIIAVLLFALIGTVGVMPGVATGKPAAEEPSAAARAILTQTRDPAVVANRMAGAGIRFLGFQEERVSLVRTAGGVQSVAQTTTTVNADLSRTVQTEASAQDVQPAAGEKAELTLTLWLYEWRNRDGTFTEQELISGSWSATEYWWIDDPVDVIDTRWTVGDLVYVSATPYDGVQRDQHTNGVASFTVADSVKAWDLFVNFRPVSSSVYGKWTNVFANYTHTWMGYRLTIALGSGASGSTGQITITTDARTWTKGTGLAFEIGSEAGSGPITATFPRPR